MIGASRQYKNQGTIAPAPPIHSYRSFSPPPIRAPAIRDGHHGTTSQVRSLFSSASRLPPVPTTTSRSYEVGTGGSLDALLKDRKSTRLNSSHTVISYAVFCLKKKKKNRKR